MNIGYTAIALDSLIYQCSYTTSFMGSDFSGKVGHKAVPLHATDALGGRKV
jgi:hypothetical protein